MELQVHLHHGVLHMLDVGGGVFHQSLPLAHIGAQRCDLGIRSCRVTTIGMRLA